MIKFLVDFGFPLYFPSTSFIYKCVKEQMTYYVFKFLYIGLEFAYGKCTFHQILDLLFLVCFFAQYLNS